MIDELGEILEVIDQNNQVMGKATRGECYQQGLLHRAVNIFIFNPKGEVFLHQRSDKKLKYPGFWDMSCSEHVKPGESFEEAAKRGLQEELGIEVPLQMIIPIHHSDLDYQEYRDNELVVTFKGKYRGEMNLDPTEVAGGRFFPLEQVNQRIKDGSMKFTPWFIKDWELLG